MDILEFTGWFLIGFPAGMLILVLGLRRLLSWMDDRGYIFYTGNPSTYGSLANAFLELQSLVRPAAQHILEVKDAEELHREEDGEAGPDDPTRHLGGSKSARDSRDRTME